MSGFLDEIQKDRGQPAIVRVGTVTGVNPLKVSVQGTEFDEVGVLNGLAPGLGKTVAVLGQSSVSADGSSWLTLGDVEPFDTSAGVHFLAEDDLIAWADNAEHNVPTYSFTASLRAGKLYRLQANYRASSSTTAADFPFVRLYQDSTQVFGQYALTQAGGVFTYNNVEVWLRPAADITSTFKMTVQRLFGAALFVVGNVGNGIFAIFDTGSHSNFVEDN
jgi:hypothetical protein